MITVDTGCKGLLLHPFAYRFVLDAFDLLIGIDQRGGIDQPCDGLPCRQGMLKPGRPGYTRGLIIVHADGIEHLLVQSEIFQQLFSFQRVHLWIGIGHLHIHIVQQAGKAPTILILTQPHSQGPHHRLRGQTMHYSFFIFHMLLQPGKRLFSCKFHSYLVIIACFTIKWSPQ